MAPGGHFDSQAGTLTRSAAARSRRRCDTSAVYTAVLQATVAPPLAAHALAIADGSDLGRLERDGSPERVVCSC